MTQQVIYIDFHSKQVTSIYTDGRLTFQLNARHALNNLIEEAWYVMGELYVSELPFEELDSFNPDDIEYWIDAIQGDLDYEYYRMEELQGA